MNAAPLPPMHAALSALGTMAGQYLAAQSAQAQAAQAQPPQAPPTVNTSYARQSRTMNGANLCDVCHAKPKYFDGTKTHSYCGRTCAAKMQKKAAPGGSPPKRGKSANAPPRSNAKLCDYCHKQPKYNDGKTTHSFCGKTCAQQAKATGATGATGASGASGGGATPAASNNGCLLCGKAAKKGCFCSQACAAKAEKNAPALLEVPTGHDTFKSVSDQFNASWRHQTSCPAVRRIYKGQFAAAGRSAGNENRRWHGTTRECLLGDNGNSKLCSSQTCSLCGILRTSYSLNLFGKKTGWGRFGAGIYTSSTSSKSNDYSNNVKPSNQKAILLNKVVVGKGYKMTQDNTTMTAPPPGHDSVLAEVVVGGSLNYDELVCYTENAIRPSYLLIYDA
ncbi:hypothetical protein PAXINDRAFT_163988 [Paxillus involutus ATCC 200175]|uniref:PARP catalytic domain-containing protein n=1 Tax=Paxillus involutus ATCC 200175 TaxID=664439 RepID=A0A0C9TW88_PAXIN|nr:hypothetical protein PAXINDRAFT_163988 [Paxillus involutus ATCC 200175]